MKKEILKIKELLKIQKNKLVKQIKDEEIKIKTNQFIIKRDWKCWATTKKYSLDLDQINKLKTQNNFNKYKK